LLMKKICFTVKTDEGEQTYKFGVMGTNNWFKTIEKQVIEYKN